MVRVICLTALLGLAANAQPQEPQSAGFTLDHVALSVSDVDRAADFYAAVLGLDEIVNRTEVDGVRWFSLGDGKELHLISFIRDPVTTNKAVHFALTTMHFDRILNALKEGGIEFSSWTGAGGQVTVRADGTRQIYLQDPDGYWIEINSVASD